jgi:hypothetical protein
MKFQHVKTLTLKLCPNHCGSQIKQKSSRAKIEHVHVPRPRAFLFDLVFYKDLRDAAISISYLSWESDVHSCPVPSVVPLVSPTAGVHTTRGEGFAPCAAQSCKTFSKPRQAKKTSYGKMQSMVLWEGLESGMGGHQSPCPWLCCPTCCPCCLVSAFLQAVLSPFAGCGPLKAASFGPVVCSTHDPLSLSLVLSSRGPGESDWLTWRWGSSPAPIRCGQEGEVTAQRRFLSKPGQYCDGLFCSLPEWQSPIKITWGVQRPLLLAFVLGCCAHGSSIPV